jgi:hypothetical protein
MSQTENRDSTISSRRAFLTGATPAAVAFALAGGAAVNAVAAGLTATSPKVGIAPEVDPIFAMIEEHRAAWCEMERTEEIFRAQPKDDRKWGIVVADLHMRWPTVETQPVIAWSRKQIRDAARPNMSDAERATWLRKMYRRLDTAKRRYKSTPYSIAWEALNDATDVVNRLTEQLVATQPVTMAGVAAALAYWSEIARDDGETDLFCTVAFLAKIAETVKTLA